ncbi:uncharacterized protein LOC126983992 isoform X2 [Eriocheir sinensis]|uniref:uncharacterized protein LOC126983992 isoform X2 n=1 Tax=Eriocheir sinensis TaxID=95602 RepID=UPI0021C80AD3|nr:uncharacterized protein LOC126983992 isoform X2 [Eriocheir sinensis]
MAAALSRSWSFFTGNQKEDKNLHLSQDYQPGTPSSRINLQERFKGGQGWRTGPLPPVPGSEPEQPNGEPPQPNTDQAPHSRPDHSDDTQVPHKPSQPQLQWDHVAARGDNAPTSSNPTEPRYPRRPLRKLPSGVTPLWDNLQDNVKQLKPQTSKILQEGGKKVNRALQGVRTSLSSLSQMFRSSTRRRYKLDGSTPTRTPRRTPRRTPGKLYSPFNISTPPTPYSHKAAKRLQSAPQKRCDVSSDTEKRAR